MLNGINDYDFRHWSFGLDSGMLADAGRYFFIFLILFDSDPFIGIDDLYLLWPVSDRATSGQNVRLCPLTV